MKEAKKIKIAQIDGTPSIEINGEVQYVDTSYLDAYNEAQRKSLAYVDPTDEKFHVYNTADDVQTGVYKELDRQFEKWGMQYHSPETWNAITMEEYGEMVSAMNKEDWDDAWKEGIEMIACAIQFLNEVQRIRRGESDGIYTRQG
jgi:hypothetical protein